MFSLLLVVFNAFWGFFGGSYWLGLRSEIISSRFRDSELIRNGFVDFDIGGNILICDFFKFKFKNCIFTFYC